MAGGEPFNFEKVEYGPRGGAGLACRSCQTPLTDTYHDVSGNKVCGDCRTRIETALTGGPGGFPRALLFGLGAAAAGAVIYWFVLTALRLQIAFVAILVAYLVAKAIRKAVPAGGRPFQILAVALTYLGCTMSYLPIVYGNFAHRRPDGSHLLLLGYAFVTSLAVPFLRLASGVSGILTPIIIGIGLWEAWKLTAGRKVLISGPFPVGARGPAGASM